MADRISNAAAWLRQAEDDLRYAKLSLGAGYFAQCCFVAQQVAEKAVKSIWLRKGLVYPLTHSITQMCKSLKINGRFLDAAAVLDLYYVSGRYPFGDATIAPFETFQKHQAEQAVAFAIRFVKKAKQLQKTKRR
ncbi:MAG: HEPN domain-containing protein [Myxococcaceae bacterium]